MGSIFSSDIQLSQLNFRNSNPTTFSCSGNASNKLKNNRIIVNMKVETTHNNKIQAYDTNVVISNRIIEALKTYGLNESSFETISFTLNEQYKFVLNKTTNLTDSVLDGYKATNEIVVRTVDLNNSGSIIDTIVRNGGTISAVNFDVTGDIVKSERLKLISSGMDDCKRQLDNVLNVIGYSLQKYTSIEIADLGPTLINQTRPISAKSFASQEGTSGGPEKLNLISGGSEIQMKIRISVNITKNNP